jgi:hypothetical protein
MRFKLTIRHPDGSYGCEWHSLATLKDALEKLLLVMDILSVSEQIEIKRVG